MSEGTNVNDRLERIENAIRAITEKLETLPTFQKEILTLIENTSQSLQREMQDGFRTVNDRLDRMETRQDLQAGKLIAGTRWIARSDEWQNRVDKILAEQAKELGEMRARLRDLEGRNGK